MGVLCFCWDIAEAKAKKTIEKQKPEHGEQVHQTAVGNDPNCGACLAHTQAMIDVYNETGKVPKLNDITADDLAKAHQKLVERFSQESNPKELYKGRFRRIPIQSIEKYGAKVTAGENAPTVSQ
jgi:bacterioferritin-associated ferredoxin